MAWAASRRSRRDERAGRSRAGADQHRRSHHRPEQFRQESALGFLGHELQVGPAGVEQPRVMRGRAETFASPGKALIRFELGDLGGHESPEGDPREAAAEPESWPRAGAVADALGVGVEAMPLLGAGQPIPDDSGVRGCPSAVGDVDRRELGSVGHRPAHRECLVIGCHLRSSLCGFDQFRLVSASTAWPRRRRASRCSIAFSVSAQSSRKPISGLRRPAAVRSTSVDRSSWIPSRGSR